MCDGESDCIFGEDEDPELCRKQEQGEQEQVVRKEQEQERQGRRLEVTDTMEPLEEPRDLVTTSIDMRMILAMFLGTFTRCSFFCLSYYS